MCDNTARAHQCSFSNGHSTQNGDIAADGGAALNNGWRANPVCFRLGGAQICGGSWIFVVNEHHPVTNEDFVLDCDTFTHERMAGNFDSFANASAFLDLHE